MSTMSRTWMYERSHVKTPSSSFLVTVLFSLKDEKGLYASRAQYLKFCLGPVSFSKYVIYKHQAELISTASSICFHKRQEISLYILTWLYFPSFWKKKKNLVPMLSTYGIMMSAWSPRYSETPSLRMESSVFPQTLNLISNSSNSHSISDLQALTNSRLLWCHRSSLHPWNGTQPCWARPCTCCQWCLLGQWFWICTLEFQVLFYLQLS